MIVLLNIPLILFLNINKCTAQSGFWDGNLLIPTTTEDQVGIGTDAPYADLHIKKDIPNFCGNDDFYLYQRFELFADFEVYNCDPKIWDILLNDNGLLFRHTTENTSGSNPTDAIFMKNNGFVGINTKDPIAQLDVYGDIAIGKPKKNFLIHSRCWDAVDGDKLMFIPWDPDNGSNGNWSVGKSLSLKNNGQVYIGTEITKGEHKDYRLAVNGKIVSKFYKLHDDAP